MAITAVDKIKLNKYLREHAVDDIYYLDMCDALGKRGKISDIEFLEHFTDSAVQELNKDSKILWEVGQDKYNIEVAGNIYDNPELLKEE